MKAGVLFLSSALALSVCGAEKSPPFLSPRCEDKVEAKAVIEPALDSKFFKVSTTSFHPMIVESEDGSIENTGSDAIGEEDLLRIEHTAECHTDHQGDHEMQFGRARATADGVELSICGGAPAYSGGLDVLIRPDLSYICSFSANYVVPDTRPRWKILSKTLRLKHEPGEAGQRLYGWISVTFEEEDTKNGAKKVNKVEGYIKPVILGKKR